MVSSPNRICTAWKCAWGQAWKCAWGQAWKCAWKCDIVQNPTFLGRFQTFGGQCIGLNTLDYAVHRYIRHGLNLNLIVTIIREIVLKQHGPKTIF